MRRYNMRGFNDMNKKTEQFLVYVTKEYPDVTITSLMKLAYLVDLVAIAHQLKQLSNFEYIRYKFGPFNKKIYDYIRKFITENTFIEKVDHSPRGDEYIIYEFNEEEDDICFDKLNQKEMAVIDEVLEKLRGLGAKALTEITYKTKPMLKLGAKPDNDVGLNEILDLSA
jgi:uncharacterized phage-associated protein